MDQNTKTEATVPGAKTPPTISRAQYRQNKDKLIEYERDNCNRISVIPCSGNQGWYEIAENSALIYSYAVCQEIGIDKPIRGDEDSFYKQYTLGRIRLKNLNEIRANLERAEFKYNVIERNHCIVFRLERRFTHAEMQSMLERELARQQDLNSIIKVTVMEPELHQLLSHTSTRIHQICPKLEKHTASVNGQRMMELVDIAIVDYYEMCKSGRKATVRDWVEIDKKLSRLQCELQLICEVKLYPREKVTDIGGMIDKMRKMLISIIRKTKMEEQENARPKVKNEKAATKTETKAAAQQLAPTARSQGVEKGAPAPSPRTTPPQG